MPAAWVSAGAAVLGAAGSVANSGGGGSTSVSTGPTDKRFSGAADQAALSWLPYYSSGANPGYSSASRMAFGDTPDIYNQNRNYLNTAQGAAQPFTNGSYVGSNPAFGYLGGMAQGGPSNPYLDATYDQAAGKVRAGIDAQFSGAGRYGSGGHQNAIGGALSDLATSLYGGQYNADQNRQLQAGATLGQIGQSERQQQLGGLALTPGLSGAQTANVNGLLNVGNYNDQIMNRDYWSPYDALQRFKNITAGQSGETTSTPYFQNNSGAYTALGKSVGDFGQKVYDWWNTPTENQPIAGMPGGYTNVNPTTFNYNANDAAYRAA